MSKQVIFSGIQPTGNLHLGNYLGAIKNWVSLQNSGQYDCYFSIVDYHSLTGDMGAKERGEKIANVAAELLALGIDPKRSTFFVQSDVPEHTELAWIFNCVTPIAELQRMTQFKDKSVQQNKNVNAGLFTYPVLQAADILLYHGNYVPVGQDQVQHIELTRDMARWFNKRYEKYFVETKPLLTETPKVMSLLEPDKKMSKSLGGAHVIELCESPSVIANKIKKAVTDSGEGGGPGARNLLLFLEKFGDKEKYKQFAQSAKAGSIRYGDLKKAVSQSIAAHFSDFREKREELLADPKELRRILDIGARKAKAVAEKTMNDVRKIVGIR